MHAWRWAARARWQLAAIVSTTALVVVLAQSALAGPLAASEERSGGSRNVLVRSSGDLLLNTSTRSPDFEDLEGTTTRFRADDGALILVRFSALSACHSDKQVSTLLRPACEIRILLDGTPMADGPDDFDSEDLDLQFGTDRHMVERMARAGGDGIHGIQVQWRVQDSLPPTECGPAPGVDTPLAPCARNPADSWGLSFIIQEWTLVAESFTND